jgi:hypothetical protein
MPVEDQDDTSALWPPTREENQSSVDARARRSAWVIHVLLVTGAVPVHAPAK